MKRLVNFFLFFLLISAVCVIASETSVAAFKNVKLGEDAPKFKLKEIASGDSVALDDYVGKEKKVVIVIFWSTWSPRSQQELGDLKELKAEFAEKGVDVLAVNVEKEDPTPEDINAMKEIIKTLDPGFNMIMDSGLGIFREYGVVAVPSTVFLDGDGVIKKIYDGYPSSAKMDMKIDVEVMLGLREPEKDIEVAEDTGPKIVKAAKLHYGLGRKLIERGMGSKAIKELEKAAKLDEKYDLPLVLLGEVYESEYRRVRKKSSKAEKLEKAVDAYKRAIDRSADNLFAYAGLVRVYAVQGKLAEADEAMTVIMKADSNFINGIIANAMLLQAKNKHEEAIKEFQHALEYNQNLPRVKYLMAKSYEKIKDYDKAIATLKSSFKQLATSVQINMAQH